MLARFSNQGCWSGKQIHLRLSQPIQCCIKRAVLNYIICIFGYPTRMIHGLMNLVDTDELIYGSSRSISSTGSTIPRAISCAQRRFTSVLYTRPFSGRTVFKASCSRFTFADRQWDAGGGGGSRARSLAQVLRAAGMEQLPLNPGLLR